VIPVFNRPEGFFILAPPELWLCSTAYSPQGMPFIRHACHVNRRHPPTEMISVCPTWSDPMMSVYQVY
jgi:hypothetical protein